MKTPLLPSLSDSVNPQTTRLFLIFSEQLCTLIIPTWPTANSQFRKYSLLVLSHTAEMWQCWYMNHVCKILRPLGVPSNSCGSSTINLKCNCFSYSSLPQSGGSKNKKKTTKLYNENEQKKKKYWVDREGESPKEKRWLKTMELIHQEGEGEGRTELEGWIPTMQG